MSLNDKGKSWKLFFSKRCVMYYSERTYVTYVILKVALIHSIKIKRINGQFTAIRRLFSCQGFLPPGSRWLDQVHIAT